MKEKLSNTTENYALHDQEITAKEKVTNPSDEKEEQIVPLALDDTRTLAIHVPKGVDEETMDITSMAQTEEKAISDSRNIVWLWAILLCIGFLLIPIGVHLFNSLTRPSNPESNIKMDLRNQNYCRFKLRSTFPIYFI